MMEDINTLINKAYRLIMQYDLKLGELSANGHSLEVLNSIDTTIFCSIENEISELMTKNTCYEELISNPIQATIVFWFMEDLGRMAILTPFINVCNYDRLIYYYACQAIRQANNPEYFKYIIIKILIRYFDRFYQFVKMYSNVFLKKEENNEEQQEIYLDLILISAILSSGDLFFCTHPDLMEVQQICSQKLIEKFRGENIDELIKRGKNNQHNLSVIIGQHYHLI